MNYSEDQWNRALAILKGDADAMSATVREGTELLVDCRERLSETLKQMSVTNEFAVTPCPYCSAPSAAAEPDAFCGYWNHGGMYCVGHPENLREAERKRECQAHRLRLEADERFPNESE